MRPPDFLPPARAAYAAAHAAAYTGAVCAAAVATGASFLTLFVTGATTALLGAALLGVALGVGGRIGALLLVPACGLYTLLAAYGGSLLSSGGWQEGASRVVRDLSEAGITLYYEMPPYDPSPGLLCLMVPAALVVVSVATRVGLGGRPFASVVLLGAALGAVSAATFGVETEPYFAAFLFSATLVLVLSGSRGDPGALRKGAAAATAAVGGVLLLPGLVPAAFFFAPAELRSPLALGAPRLDARTDVGAYLNTERETVLFEVASPEPLYWRGGTLDHFDGARWHVTASRTGGVGEEAASGVERLNVEQTVRISESRTDVLFGGYVAASVSGARAEQLPDGSWVAEEPLTAGDAYRVVSEVPQPTQRQLLGAGRAYPAGMRERYLQLPRGLPPEVEATAEEVRRAYGPRTSYEVALAVERYLLYDGGFSYDLGADFRRPEEAIGEFLGDGREGFCVQFATSMALILREMGVPSRVVYGATTGEEMGDGEYVVTGSNMHTWVEAYFPGVGWHPFEPTPGAGLPAAMEATPSPNAPLAAGGLSPPPSGSRPHPWAPRPAALAQASAGESAPDFALRLWQLAIAFAGALGCIPLGKRLAVVGTTADALYGDVVRRLEDLPWPVPKPARLGPPSFTPTERLGFAARRLGLEPGPFEELARAYSEHLYSAAPRADVRAAHRAAVAAYRTLPLWRRLAGAFNPSSLARASVSAGRDLSRGVRGPEFLRLRRRGRTTPEPPR